MSDLRCPRCGESFRIPSVDLPSGPPAADLSARCPWCAEIIPLTQLLTALPPVAQLIGHDGQPLEVTASSGQGENPFALQSAGLPAAADADALTAGTFPGEEAFSGAEDFTDDSFDFAAADVAERDADGNSYLGDDRDVGDGQDGETSNHYGDFAGSGTDFDDAGFEAAEQADEFEVGEHAGPVDPRPIEEVSGVSFAPDGHLVTPRARAKKKSSSLRSILGVVAGGLLALPLAAGILALLGKPLDLGFWPFDGKTIASGGSARTAAPMLPMSDEPRPARPPQQGRSLAEDMPSGELMTMEPAEEPGLPGDEQPAARQSENPWEVSRSPGQPSPVGPEMVTPQLAEEAEPEAAAADAPAFDPFAGEPFAADSRSGDGAAPEVADPRGADPSAAAPDDFAASMNSDPFAALEQPFAPLESEPAAADPAAAAAKALSLDDPLLTLPADRADAAAQPRDEAEMSQQDAAAPDAAAPDAAAATDAAATDAAAELGESELPASEPATEAPTEASAAEANTTEAPSAETPAPLAPVTEVTAEPTAEEASEVTPAEPAGDDPAMAPTEPPSPEPQPEASPDAQPTDAAAAERLASSPEFAAAQTAAESALQAIRDYDLAAGVAGLRPHLAKLYEHVAALGELANPQDAPALTALTEQILEINVLKDLAPAAPNWAKYSRRPNDGMLAVGPLRQEADTWFLDWGAPTPLEIRFSQGDADVQPQAKVLVLGRILSSEPSAPAVEATFLQSLD